MSTRNKEKPTQQQQGSLSTNPVDDNAPPGDLFGDTENSDIAPIQHWIREGTWPQGNLEQVSNISQLLTRKRSIPSISNHKSDISSVSLREGKNPAVKSRRYQQILESVRIYMSQPEPHLRATKADKALCRELIDQEQPVPEDSLFNKDLIEWTLEDISNRNEARVIQDIGRLIVPAPEEFARRGATHLKHLIETVDEGWIKSIPLVNGPRP